MKNTYIKRYKNYLKESENKTIDTILYPSLSDLNDSLNVWYDTLIASIDAEEMDMFEFLNLKKEEFENNTNVDLEYLNNNKKFLNSLLKKSLKKSQIYNTEDYSTFLDKPCKFMFLYDINANELENPSHILFQFQNDSVNNWSNIKFYKIKDDINKFFNKLTSKTIEIIENDKNYIYSTSNCNEWILQNLEKENETYKKILRKDELEKIIKNRNVKIKVI